MDRLLPASASFARTTTAALVASAAPAIAAVISLPAFAGNGVFTDVTASSGVSAQQIATYGDGFPAGGTVGDFDRDGWQDVYFATGGGAPDRLFMNNGDGTFTDRAASWGIAVSHRGTGAVCGDVNGDGWLDLFVTSFGPAAGPEAPGRHRLYINSGAGTFTEEALTRGAAASSPTQADGWGGAFGDYDLDGDLDLAIAGWRDASTGNRLLRNDGTGYFTDVTATAGLSTLAGVDGFAPRFVDLDGDRFPELVWIGDFGTSRYFVNNGNGTFSNATSSSGMGLDGTEMGCTVADWDGDGDFDVYVTTIVTNNLYVNQGNHSFTNRAAAAGVENTGWGWGTVAVDFDQDSLVDIVATSQSSRQYAFRNVTAAGGPLAFAEVGLGIGLTSTVSGRGLSNFDYDNDGDQDLVIFPRGGAVTLYRNDISGADAHWLRVFLDAGGQSGVAPNGIGAVVRARIGTRTLTGRIDGGSNYLSQSELSAHFGLGTALRVDELRVEWPNGTVTTQLDVAANQTLAIRADSSVAQYCFGDGGNGAGCTSCPCTNDAAVGGGGCLNSDARSARLDLSGLASVSGDTLSLRIRGATSTSFAVLVSGDNQLPAMGICAPGSGLASAALDGLRCTGGILRRHGSRATDGSGLGTNSWGPPGGPVGGLIASGGFTAGQSRAFQAFYRENPALSCGTGQNTTQGVRATFAP